MAREIPCGGHARITIESDYERMSARAADWLVEAIRRQSDLLLCVATGASPLGAYRELARRASDGAVAVDRLRILKLDEWGPLPPDDPGSCEAYIRREVLDPLRIAPDRYFAMRGDVPDPQAECRRFRETLAALGPIDVSVLGVGTNGHLGLNEPGPWLHDGVHVAELAPSSQGHGMLATARTRPTHGLTLGMGDLLRSRKLLLLVSGADKRPAMRALLDQRLRTEFPASFLWLHRNLTVICDAAAWPEE
ncbi:MAG TPA: 6-phosphogluconolactonase [Candidatus Hydrogenedentes bacterium]|nr:6-phosphogluconolactonase [Candidatus Hydrogenedentota bacterium]